MNPMSESTPRTLYVGNLSDGVSEEFLLTLFNQIGPCKSCKIIYEPGNAPYAFVELLDASSAAAALAAFNNRMVLGKEMKVKWAASPNTAPKQDTSKHFHVFVGDLSTDIEQHQLREAFTVYGEISDCKIIRDPATMKSKGYGFVSFVNKADAESAINGMNGQWLGSRPIRTNWATRQPPAPVAKENTRPLEYEKVHSQSSPTNCTVYCGGVTMNLTEELMRETFDQFGAIQDIRVFKEKGYAFVRFGSKEEATKAICGVHGTMVAEQQVKCSWGKESNESSGPPQQMMYQQNQQQQQYAPAQAPYNQYYNMGYYNGGAPYGGAPGYQAQMPAQGQYIPGQWQAYPNYQAYGSMNMQAAPMGQYTEYQGGQQQQQQFNGQGQGVVGYPVQGFQPAQ